MEGTHIIIYNPPYSKLKTCKYCENYFIYKHNRETYCNDKCRYEGRRDKQRGYDKTYYRRYKDIINRKVKGTGWLGAHAHDDFDSEYYEIQKEMRRLRIRT